MLTRLTTPTAETRAPKRGEQHPSERDAYDICDPVGELGISVDEATLNDLDQATEYQHADHHRQRAPFESTGAPAAQPSHDRKQDGERVDEVRGRVQLVIGTMTRGSWSQGVPERECRRSERERPDPDIDPTRSPSGCGAVAVPLGERSCLPVRIVTASSHDVRLA
jgi:hypothetical protein